MAKAKGMRIPRARYSPAITLATIAATRSPEERLGLVTDRVNPYERLEPAFFCRSTTFTSRTEGHAVWPRRWHARILQPGVHIGAQPQKISGSEFKDPEPLAVWPSFTC